MTRILLVGGANDLEALAAALAQTPGVELRWVQNREEALDQVRRWRPTLAVLDRSQFPGQPDPWDLLRDLTRAEAGLTSAVVSDQEPEGFHRASAGLGVLTQLPPRPGPAEAAWLLFLMGEATPALA